MIIIVTVLYLPIPCMTTRSIIIVLLIIIKTIFKSIICVINYVIYYI